MANESKISIIVPCFNAQSTIEKSLKSLVYQTFQNLEIIVVDDCSTDATPSRIARLASEFHNFNYVRLDENKGVHEARLAGLKKVTSPWVGFLDADDIALPNMYQRMYEAGVREDVDIVICGSWRVTSEGKRVSPKVVFPSDTKISQDLFGKFCRWEFGTGALWNKLYRYEVIAPFQNLHFDWRQNFNEDLLLNIGCFSSATSAYLMKDILHKYVDSFKSATSQMQRSTGYMQTFRAYALALNLYKNRGYEILEQITELYRRQLGFSCYQLDNLKELNEESRNRIEEAVCLIQQVYPLGLYLIASRHLVPPLTVKFILDKGIKIIKNRIGLGG